jgi:hypothetical protein
MEDYMLHLAVQASSQQHTIKILNQIMRLNKTDETINGNSGHDDMRNNTLSFCIEKFKRRF